MVTAVTSLGTAPCCAGQAQCLAVAVGIKNHGPDLRWAWEEHAACIGISRENMHCCFE